MEIISVTSCLFRYCSANRKGHREVMYKNMEVYYSCSYSNKDNDRKIGKSMTEMKSSPIEYGTSGFHWFRNKSKNHSLGPKFEWKLIPKKFQLRNINPAGLDLLIFVISPKKEVISAISPRTPIPIGNQGARHYVLTRCETLEEGFSYLLWWIIKSCHAARLRTLSNY